MTPAEGPKIPVPSYDPDVRGDAYLIWDKHDDEKYPLGPRGDYCRIDDVEPLERAYAQVCAEVERLRGEVAHTDRRWLEDANALNDEITRLKSRDTGEHREWSPYYDDHVTQIHMPIGDTGQVETFAVTTQTASDFLSKEHNLAVLAIATLKKQVEAFRALHNFYTGATLDLATELALLESARKCGALEDR